MQDTSTIRGTIAEQLTHVHATDPDGRAARRAEVLRQQRERLQTRHSAALTTLMEARRDLRGVHALADFVDEGVRWSA